jgi:membrane protease YdiL (CAAX protease family)
MRINAVPSRFPLRFTLAALLITALVGILLAGVAGVQWLHMSISAVAAIALAILLRRHIGNVFILPKPRDALLFGTPLLVYPMLTPLMTGGYNFALLSPQLVIYMASVGIYEEVLIHGIAMNLLVNRYVHASREPALLRAALVSSLLFGILHLASILQNPHDRHWWAFKTSTVAFAFLISLGFAGLVVVTRSIWPAAIIHGVIDVFALNVGDPAALQQIVARWWVNESLVAVAFCLPMAAYGVALLTRKVSPPPSAGDVAACVVS